MFTKISRYRKLHDTVAVDKQGRTLVSRDLRPFAEATGSFSHIVEEGDRLDHIAYKYYRQPQKWWRICDANPDFMSPQSLLGKDTSATTRFSVKFYGSGNPPWHDLCKKLMIRIGVEDVSIQLDGRLAEEAVDYHGQPVKVTAEYFNYIVTVVYNRMNIAGADIKSIIESAGFNAEDPGDVGRVGQKIIIPPNIVG